MQTVDKAMELLGHFSERNPEYGLSELSRTTGFDKATTRRLLLSLIKHNYIEQCVDTKSYRVGSGVLRLARVREVNSPLERIYKPLLSNLVSKTDETAHFAILSAGKLSNIGIHESAKANRIHFALGEEAAIHATASGIVSLAFCSAPYKKSILNQQLVAFTDKTIVDKTQLGSLLNDVHNQGYFINNGMYEEDVCSIAAPVFNSTIEPVGAIAVAVPKSRFSTKQQKLILYHILDAAKNASISLGAELEQLPLSHQSAS
ncbi:MAG: IclR family transcriptional regulator [Gammaproteobacteria bacterium]|nr:IclR family transcriptional regulator [Gammaproteobacteria bacterium]